MSTAWLGRVGFAGSCAAMDCTVESGGQLGVGVARIVIVGDRPSDLAMAARRVADMHGGVEVVREGRVVAEWAAPVAGLYGNGPASEVVSEVAAASGALSSLGCRWPNPILSLEVLTTAAIPLLRISPAGYRRLRDGAQVGLEWGP